ncbi:MAG TPA: hypothetical protein VGQ97_08155 [Xanthobacteraceae bacterium]|nr:hypothetical protein [Xanthobacteraceae bacterium]
MAIGWCPPGASYPEIEATAKSGSSAAPQALFHDRDRKQPSAPDLAACFEEKPVAALGAVADFQEDVHGAATVLVNAVKLLRAGRFVVPDAGIHASRPEVCRRCDSPGKKVPDSCKALTYPATIGLW